MNDIFLNDLPQITENHIRLTETPLLIEELDRALKAMKPGKTPGTDGLSVEFYQFFWNDIKEIVFDSIKNAYENNKMSEDQRRAVLRLIPKKDKDMTDLKNWRPISLLNTDYKILAQSLAMRLQKVLPEIISKEPLILPATAFGVVELLKRYNIRKLRIFYYLKLYTNYYLFHFLNILTYLFCSPFHLYKLPNISN